MPKTVQRLIFGTLVRHHALGSGRVECVRYRGDKLWTGTAAMTAVARCKVAYVAYGAYGAFDNGQRAFVPVRDLEVTQ